MDVVMKKLPSGRERPQEKDFDDKRRVVRVVPKNDQIRKYLKHGITKVGFLAEGSAEWPNDAFTKRRIRDGDVTVEQREAPREARREEHREQPREQRPQEAPGEQPKT
jgi:hypothetical protein